MSKLSISKVIKQRDKTTEYLHTYLGTTLSGKSLLLFADDIIATLPAGIELSTIFSSIQLFAGSQITQPILKDLAWRLAGNIDSLKEGRVLKSWTVSAEPEWVPVQITSAKYIRKKKDLYDKGVPAYLYKMTILAGSPCTLTMTRAWTVKACRLYARELGFTSNNGNFPYSNPQEFVSLRFMAEITKERCRDNQPGFDRIKVTSALKNWNRSIMRMRMRDTFTCPENYEIPCYLCWHGYNSCPAACRKIDLERRSCNGCNDDGWFDPEDRAGKFCLDCVQR